MRNAVAHASLEQMHIMPFNISMQRSHNHVCVCVKYGI
jgi:hypothetical protein